MLRPIAGPTSEQGNERSGFSSDESVPIVTIDDRWVIAASSYQVARSSGSPLPEP